MQNPLYKTPKQYFLLKKQKYYSLNSYLKSTKYFSLC